MLTKTPPGWQLPESAATPKDIYLNRRKFMASAAAGTIAAGAAAGALGPRRAWAAMPDGTYPPATNEAFASVGRQVTPMEEVTTYNNFYEFGSFKKIYERAQKLPIDPWQVRIDGLVEEEKTIDAYDLIKKMELEQRVYRFRCVEAWAMTVPWSGFPLADLVDFAKPLGSAKYLQMQTFENKDVARGQRQPWYPWPYTEALTMAEATNELALVGTGMYDDPMPKQNGAPLRLVTPWKYGFKSVKSIVRFTFTEERPKTFWEEVQGDEYGFWANVNPDVPHPRWSQAQEELIGQDKEVPTQLYNGYADYVAHLYKDRADDPWTYR